MGQMEPCCKLESNLRDCEVEKKKRAGRAGDDSQSTHAVVT